MLYRIYVSREKHILIIDILIAHLMKIKEREKWIGFAKLLHSALPVTSWRNFLLVSCYFFLVACYFLLIARYFLPVARCVLLVACYFLFVSNYFLFVTRDFLLVARHFFFRACYFLLVAHYFLLLLVTFWSLYVLFSQRYYIEYPI